MTSRPREPRDWRPPPVRELRPDDELRRLAELRKTDPRAYRRLNPNTRLAVELFERERHHG